MTPVTETIEEVVELTGVTHPNPGPFTDCTALMIAWNEAHRIEAPLQTLKAWFTHLVVGVQASTDPTLRVVRELVNRPTDQVIEEPHHGYGDASMQRLMDAATTRWVFVLAADEMPSLDLLQSLWSATAYAEAKGFDGIWIPFVSITEGVGSLDTQAGHLRLFHRSLDWPITMHSRPKPNREMTWPFGHIRHERSLDEMMRDYLRIYQIGRTNVGWRAHNLLMMHDACEVIAQHYGWEFVTSHDWWPQVEALAFAKE